MSRLMVRSPQCVSMHMSLNRFSIHKSLFPITSIHLCKRSEEVRHAFPLVVNRV